MANVLVCTRLCCGLCISPNGPFRLGSPSTISLKCFSSFTSPSRRPSARNLYWTQLAPTLRAHERQIDAALARIRVPASPPTHVLGPHRSRCNESTSRTVRQVNPLWQQWVRSLSSSKTSSSERLDLGTDADTQHVRRTYGPAIVAGYARRSSRVR